MRQLLMVPLVLALAVAAAPSWAGSFSGPTDTTHAIDPAIPSGSPLFVEWADEILPLGAGTYFAPGGVLAISTTGYNALGDLSAEEIVRGDSPGYLTVSFPRGIRNGSGFDFAVFENGGMYFPDPYLHAELAYVEVSSSGTDFARFPSISTNTTYYGTYGPDFGGYDSTQIHNLAGKHANGYGTPFDLGDLVNDPLVLSGAVDLDNIQYVRLVDIPGSGAFLDSKGHPILDNWPTYYPDYDTAGFDFRLPAGQGIGVINAVPEPSALGLLAMLGATFVGTRRNRRPR